MLDNVLPAVEPEPSGVDEIQQGDWTAARIDQLTELWISGLTCSQIAAALGGVSRSAVIGKVSRLGLNQSHPRPRSPSKQRRPLLTLEEKAERQQAARAAWYERQPPRARRADGSLPPLVIVETAPSVEFLSLSFEQLTWRDGKPVECRYMRDDLYCGQPVKPEHSWCEHCCGIVYQPPRPR